MKAKNLFLSLLTIGLCCACTQNKQQEETTVVMPTAHQAEWADCEVGVLFHFDMPTFKPEYDYTKFGTHPDAATFNPSALNTDQWLETAQKLGAKYAILVAKHCSGFSLWPTEAHDYSVKNTPWENGKGDIVRDFINSCKKYNIKPGIYASTSFNGYLHVDRHKIAADAPVTQQEYNNIVIKQLTELWSNYGKLFEVWFDGGLLTTEEGGADVLSLLNKLQPGAIAFQGPYGYPDLIRWVGNEEGAAPYPCWATADSTTNADGTIGIKGLNGDPNAPYWCPGESDFTLRWNKSFQGGWFWHADQDTMMFTLDQLMKKYETSVGRNTNMLLGVVIDNRGLVPDADVNRITELGSAIKAKYGTPLKTVSGNAKELTLTFDQPTAIDRVIIQEDITKGERVLAYTIKGKINGQWQTVASGTNIGHKHIDQFAPQPFEALQLVVSSAKATPQIKNFAAYQEMK